MSVSIVSPTGLPPPPFLSLTMFSTSPHRRKNRGWVVAGAPAAAPPYAARDEAAHVKAGRQVSNHPSVSSPTRDGQNAPWAPPHKGEDGVDQDVITGHAEERTPPSPTTPSFGAGRGDLGGRRSRGLQRWPLRGRGRWISRSSYAGVGGRVGASSSRRLVDDGVRVTAW
jgi:hypothetical protein